MQLLRQRASHMGIHVILLLGTAGGAPSLSNGHRSVQGRLQRVWHLQPVRVSPMGKRLLRLWFRRPIINLTAIKDRQVSMSRTLDQYADVKTCCLTFSWRCNSRLYIGCSPCTVIPGLTFIVSHQMVI